MSNIEILYQQVNEHPWLTTPTDFSRGILLGYA